MSFISEDDYIQNTNQDESDKTVGPILNKTERFNIRLLFLIIFVAIVIFLATIIYLLSTGFKKTDSLTRSNSSRTNDSLMDSKSECLNSPEFYPKTGWTERVSDKVNEKSLGNGALYVDYQPTGLTGKEFENYQQNITLDEMQKLSTAFQEYYNRELIGRGWQQKVKIGTSSAMPIVAGGPGGSIRGYIKICNDNLRVIILQRDIPVEAFGAKSKTDSKTFFVRHKIFISDVVPLSQIIPRK
jgi:hypothetical protein